MFFKKSVSTMMETAVAGVNATLADRRKIEAALQAGLEDLKPLIQARIDAETALADAEVREALGEARGGAIAAASQRVEKAVTAIEKHALKLSALRSRIIQQGTDLDRAHRAISEQLPPYIEDLRKRFSQEWTEAVEAFNAVISRRKALEGIVGRMELPMPDAGPADLGEVSEPHQALTDIAVAIERFMAWERCASSGAYVGTLAEPRAYDPRGLFTIADASGFDDCIRGEVVVDCSFPRGVLRRLVMAGYAVPYSRPEDQEGITAAEAAQHRITKAAEKLAKERADAEREAMFKNAPQLLGPMSILPRITRQ